MAIAFGRITITALPAVLVAQGPVDWANLQFPVSAAASLATPTVAIYGRVFKAGVTEAAGPAPGLVAGLGYGPDGSDPATNLGWQWVTASFNIQFGNDDEYTAMLTVPAPGTYDYAFRYSHNGSGFVYGDLDGSANGYSVAQAGSLTITGIVAPVDWGNLQFPTAIVIGFGAPTPAIYGRVFKAGVTEAAGPAPGLVAELGYGPDGSDPATSPLWVWVVASFNVQLGNDDEYEATLAVPAPGAFDYAFRYSHYGSAFVYGDLDGSANGYSPAQAGNLGITGWLTLAYGCETPAVGYGAPALAVTAGAPLLGTTFDLTIQNASPSAVAAALGFQLFAPPASSPQSSTVLFGFCWNLPLDFAATFVPVPTSVVLPLAVPVDLGMLGATIDWQVIAIDPASTSLELAITASSGLTTRIGM